MGWGACGGSVPTAIIDKFVPSWATFGARDQNIFGCLAGDNLSETLKRACSLS